MKQKGMKARTNHQYKGPSHHPWIHPASVAGADDVEGPVYPGKRSGSGSPATDQHCGPCALHVALTETLLTHKSTFAYLLLRLGLLLIIVSNTLSTSLLLLTKGCILWSLSKTSE